MNSTTSVTVCDPLNPPAIQTDRRLTFNARGEVFHFFAGLLQQGFYININSGQSVKQVLCGALGFDSEYITQRIKTIFYNSKPVDHIETALVQPGSTLALSAAMPGLAGATFRSGGALSPFRSGISYQPETPVADAASSGLIRVKLFNLLVPEVGPGLLQRGIIMEGQVLDAFFKNQDAQFWENCGSLLQNDQPVNIQQLTEDDSAVEATLVELRVIGPSLAVER